jgi:hypothetical protein
MKKEITTNTPKKYTRVFTDENSTTTWFYDEAITTKGPVEVVIKYNRVYEANLNKEISKTVKKART